MHEHKVVAGITQGDINGIGYEVIIKTLQDPRILEFCTPVVYGSPKVLAYHRKAIHIPNFSLNSIMSAKDANPKRANLINCLDDNVRVELGKSTPIAGESSIIALDQAIKDLMDYHIDVLVTAPVNKHNIKRKDFHFTGHTEYLQHKLNAKETLMMMVSDQMKVGVVTGHIPLSEVADTISGELIRKKVELMNRSLKDDFNIREPRIAVLGLNPHGGDEGLLGKEEGEIIKPVIREMRNEGMMVLGPYPADGFFGSGLYRKFDGIMAMYHDQGLTPFKALAFEGGVNFTAGLPFVRTSPAHGTAYELAGLNQASPDAFRQALFLACEIYRTRKQNRKMTKAANNTSDVKNES